MSWRDGRRVVDEPTLLAWWRDRLQADPAHQYRLRALRAEPEQHDAIEQQGASSVAR